MGGIVRQWVKRSYRRVRENGWSGLQRSLYLLQRGLWRGGQKLPVGTNAFEREWDVLVILDGCRVDLMREIAPEYGFEDVDTIWSVGSTSAEWIRETFAEQPDSDESVAYVTANPFVDDYRHLLTSVDVDDVWVYGFEEDSGTIPPRIVSDRAIATQRRLAPDRLVVHYMQPHHPFIGETQSVSIDTSVEDIVGKREAGNDDEWEAGTLHANNVWYALKRGTVDSDALWDSYRSNLELVLDDVTLLLKYVDGRVAITADHGNAMGELGMYGHPMGFLHPSVRKGPWVECTATDEGTHTPAEYERHGGIESREEQLEALGYR